MLGAVRSGTIGKRRVEDPYFNNVVLYLPMTGINGRSVFPDCSYDGLVPTINGNTVVSTTQSKWGTGSGYFDGNGDYLSLLSNKLSLASGDFTIEFWLYVTAVRDHIMMGSRLPYGWLIAISSGAIGFSFWETSGTYHVALGPSISFDEWNYFAVCRSGNTYTAYVNGVGGTPVTTAARPDAGSTTLNIGRDPQNSINQFNGYLQDLRITKGVARYTSTFTPPTRSFYFPKDPYYTSTVLLLPFTGSNNSTVIKDYSWDQKTVTVYGTTSILTAESKWGNGSLYFNGTTSRLFVSGGTTTNLGTADFTIEAWCFIKSASNGFTVDSIFCMGDYYNSFATSFLFYVFNDTNLAFYGGGINIFAGTVPLDTWTHLAVTRSGNTFSIFIDGVFIDSASSSPNFSGDILIGAQSYYDSTTMDYYGYMQDMRVTKGIARYTSTFTPPTRALPLG